MKQSMPKKIASGAIRLGLIVTILIAFSLVWDNLTVVADGEPDA